MGRPLKMNRNRQAKPDLEGAHTGEALARQPLSPLLADLLNTASKEAELLRRGLDISQSASMIVDLELSPLMHRQLLAVALRLADNLDLTEEIGPSVVEKFTRTLSNAFLEPQRRAVENEVRETGLPMSLAADYARTLERGLSAPSSHVGAALWEYATLYEELWSDPRLGAGAQTRRLMLAMTTVLRTRSAQLAAEKAGLGSRRRALHR